MRSGSLTPVDAESSDSDWDWQDGVGELPRLNAESLSEAVRSLVRLCTLLNQDVLLGDARPTSSGSNDGKSERTVLRRMSSQITEDGDQVRERELVLLEVVARQLSEEPERFGELTEQELLAFVAYVFHRRFGWSEVPTVEANRDDPGTDERPDRSLRSSTFAEYRHMANQRAELLVEFLREQPLSQALVETYRMTAEIASWLPVVRKQVYLHHLAWVHRQLEVSDSAVVAWEAISDEIIDVIVAGITDVWSATRHACADKLSNVVASLLVEQTEPIMRRLCTAAVAPGASWQSVDGAVLGICSMLKVFRLEPLGNVERSKDGMQFLLFHQRSGMQGGLPSSYLELPNVIHSLLTHEQVSIRESAVRAFRMFLFRSPFSETLNALQHIHEWLKRAAPGRTANAVDAFEAQALLGVGGVLIKLVRFFELDTWPTLLRTFLRYLSHPASTVRQQASDVFRLLLASNPEPDCVSLLLQALTIGWGDESFANLDDEDSSEWDDDSISSEETGFSYPVPTAPLPDPLLGVDAGSPEAVTWEWKEGRLLAYDLVFKFLLSNFQHYSFPVVHSRGAEDVTSDRAEKISSPKKVSAHRRTPSSGGGLSHHHITSPKRASPKGGMTRSISLLGYTQPPSASSLGPSRSRVTSSVHASMSLLERCADFQHQQRSQQVCVEDTRCAVETTQLSTILQRILWQLHDVYATYSGAQAAGTPGQFEILRMTEQVIPQIVQVCMMFDVGALQILIEAIFGVPLSDPRSNSGNWTNETVAPQPSVFLGCKIIRSLLQHVVWFKRKLQRYSESDQMSTAEKQKISCLVNAFVRPRVEPDLEDISFTVVDRRVFESIEALLHHPQTTPKFRVLLLEISITIAAEFPDVVGHHDLRRRVEAESVTALCAVSREHFLRKPFKVCANMSMDSTQDLEVRRRLAVQAALISATVAWLPRFVLHGLGHLEHFSQVVCSMSHLCRASVDVVYQESLLRAIKNCARLILGTRGHINPSAFVGNVNQVFEGTSQVSAQQLLKDSTDTVLNNLIALAQEQALESALLKKLLATIAAFIHLWGDRRIFVPRVVEFIARHPTIGKRNGTGSQQFLQLSVLANDAKGTLGNIQSSNGLTSDTGDESQTDFDDNSDWDGSSDSMSPRESVLLGVPAQKSSSTGLLQVASRPSTPVKVGDVDNDANREAFSKLVDAILSESDDAVGTVNSVWKLLLMGEPRVAATAALDLVPRRERSIALALAQRNNDNMTGAQSPKMLLASEQRVASRHARMAVLRNSKSMPRLPLEAMTRDE